MTCYLTEFTKHIPSGKKLELPAKVYNRKIDKYFYNNPQENQFTIKFIFLMPQLLL